MIYLSKRNKNIRKTYTKELLINSFLHLIDKKDFEKITIADITSGASVNRATFYAHFEDKYELLDYVVNESAINMIEKYTDGISNWKEIVRSLVLAVCEFHSQPNIQCRQSYLQLIPQIKEKMLFELKQYLHTFLKDKYKEQERELYVTVYSSSIVEAGYLWATGGLEIDKEEVATRVVTMLYKEANIST